jgi:tripartite-type tricarboxylate transporter receptor subunit TctC
MNKLSFAAGGVTTAVVLAVAGMLSAVTQVQAQTYPVKPVRLIVPFPPGGSNDIVGRLVGAGLGERLGKQVVIDNRAGGNSIIGTEIAAASQPDGYTLLVISTSFTTNPIVHNKLPFDSKKAFAWVAMLGIGPNALAVHPSFPAKTVPELIALAKARPDYVTYASTGVGGNAHLGTELFKYMTGTRMLHIPYKGGGPALIATIGGQAHICLSSLIQVIGHFRSGKLRAVATTAAKRSTILPDVPTISETVPGYETANWWGIAVPRGTPPAVIKRLNDEIRVVLENPDTAKRLVQEGAEPAIKTPDELGRYVISEMDKWAKVAKIAGIRGE